MIVFDEEPTAILLLVGMVFIGAGMALQEMIRRLPFLRHRRHRRYRH
jgi:hypothetical protein